MPARDEAEAIARGLDGGHFFGYSLLHYYVFGNHVPGRTNIWEEFQQNRSLWGFDREHRVPGGRASPSGPSSVEGKGFGSLRGAIGTPEQIRTLLAGYEAAGVDQVIFVSQAGNNRHEHICESLELFATEVMPEFHEHEDRARRSASSSGSPRRSRPPSPAVSRLASWRATRFGAAAAV